MKKSEQLKSYHEVGNPLVLYNCWDEASATIIEEKGATVIATSSYAVALAHGYEDGEQFPFHRLVDLSKKLVAQTTLPVTIDCEGLYAETDATLRANAVELFKTGIAGINFEDRLMSNVSQYELWPTAQQAHRIEVLKEAAQGNVFINARTDIFLQRAEHSIEDVEEALIRTRAYAEAGADSIFVPGLVDRELLARFVEQSPLPVNIMLDEKTYEADDWARTGVSRVSYGPHIYVRGIESFHIQKEL